MGAVGGTRALPRRCARCNCTGPHPRPCPSPPPSQNANLALGPQAWGHWGVVVAACLLGVAAHALGSQALVVAHAALGIMAGAALGGYNTAFWYTLQAR